MALYVSPHLFKHACDPSTKAVGTSRLHFVRFTSFNDSGYPKVREDHSRLVDAEVLRGPADSRVLLTPGSSLLSDATNTAASQLSLNS